MVDDTQDTVQQLHAVQEQLERLVEEVVGEEDGGGGVIGGGEGDGWRAAHVCVNQISPLVTDIGQLERLQNYLTWLRYIEQLRYIYTHLGRE